MSDEMLAKNLSNNPHWAYLDGYLPNASKKCVNLQTLEIQDRPAFQPDIVEYIRSQRANLLRNSDWTQMPDSPLSESKRAEWAVYRQALRDMPDTTTATTVEAIVWPVRP
jgi:O-glycosyl hydrolase